MLTCFKYTDKQGELQRIYIVDEMAPKWERVGRMLKFTEANITSMGTTCRDEPERCCENLLSQWLQGRNDSNDSRPKTWETLLEVMKDARLGELADKIKKILT